MRPDLRYNPHCELSLGEVSPSSALAYSGGLLDDMAEILIHRREAIGSRSSGNWAVVRQLILQRTGLLEDWTCFAKVESTY